MNTGVFMSFITVGLAVLLARENKLRRGLQRLCGRLLSRLGDFQKSLPRPSPTSQDQRHPLHDASPRPSKHLPSTSSTAHSRRSRP